MDTPTLSQPVVQTVESNDKILSVFCHVSSFLGVPFILPLIVYLVTRKQSRFVEFHAREVLNFHISLLLYAVCTIPLIILTCGLFIYPAILGYMALALLAFICAIVGAIKASEGDFFYYPLTIRFIS